MIPNNNESTNKLWLNAASCECYYFHSVESAKCFNVDPCRVQISNNEEIKPNWEMLKSLIINQSKLAAETMKHYLELSEKKE
jgi:hypothetical protein